MVRSRIIVGDVMHARSAPVHHEFSYPLYMYSFDIDELPALDKKHRWFGYNRAGLVSIHDKDYLAGIKDGDFPSYTGGDIPIRKKLEFFLQKYRFNIALDRVVLVTAARYFNYVFNPVSFYYCYDSSGRLSGFIAEVNNTFDERHLYILNCHGHDFSSSGKNLINIRTEKAFHVSPFNDMQGDYNFFFADIERTLDIRINIVKDGRTVFVSRLSGTLREFSLPQMASVLVRFPFTAALSMPRILWQAAKLKFLHKLPVFRKPNPQSPYTLKVARPGFFEHICRNLLIGLLQRIRRGSLTLVMPDGEQLKFGETESELNATLRVRRHSFFTDCVKGGAVGFGESYAKKDWETDDLTPVIRLLIENREFIDEKMLFFSRAGRLWNFIRHSLRHNSPEGSRKNITAHYDLGNEFFSLFLDPTLSYSSAWFEDSSRTLEEAQKAKIRKLLEKACIEKDSHLLEIGSGWGALATEAARSESCRVTSVTLSHEQLKLANQRIAEAGLADRAEVKYCDYRSISGRYDRIISVEMLEAVGHRYLGDFFRKCDELLAPDGLAVLQVITIPDQRYSRYLYSSDWIQKYIFPGSCLPSMTAMSDAITRNSSLIIESVENIGPHYAPTLRIWRENMLAAREQILAMGYDETFIRNWEYYFSYCEAAFASRTLNVLQMVLTRPKNTYLLEKDREHFESSPPEVVKLRA